MARRDAAYDMQIKLLIVGDEMTGKTPLLLKYADGTFNPNKIIKTIGIDFKIKTVLLDGKRVKLQIWDTVGSRRFKSSTIAHLPSAQGILLLYSVYSRHTFDSIRDWMATIRMVHTYIAYQRPYTDWHHLFFFLARRCQCEYIASGQLPQYL